MAFIGLKITEKTHSKSFSSFRVFTMLSSCLLSPCELSKCFLMDAVWSWADANLDLSLLICARHVWKAPCMAAKELSTKDGERDLPRLSDLEPEWSRRGDLDVDRLESTFNSSWAFSNWSQWLTTSWAICFKPSSMDSTFSVLSLLEVPPSMWSKPLISLPAFWILSSMLATEFSRLATNLSLSEICAFSLSFTTFNSLFLKKIEFSLI